MSSRWSGISEILLRVFMDQHAVEVHKHLKLLLSYVLQMNLKNYTVK